MSAEIALIAGSSVAGAISAALLGKLSRIRSDASSKSLHKPSANTVRTELVSLLFEKTLSSEAITRVYEASQVGKIDRLERDRLLLKYKQQLDSLNSRIAQLQPAAEYADLREMRNDLATILQDKIAALDQRLEALSKLTNSDDVSMDTQVQKIIAETTAMPPSRVDLKPKTEEKSIEQLQNEIVQALDRLEQVEIDKE